ncbi:MAG: sugar ABC transporter permease [Propionibacteriaceae bacterium]
MTVTSPAGTRLSRQRFTPGSRRWLLVLLFPITIGLGLVYFSAFQGLALGFTDWNLISPASWVGLDNFTAIVHDARFWLSLRNTFTIVVLTVPAKVVLGLVLAVLLNRVVRGSSFFRLALFFPTSCSVVAVAFLWTYLYDVDGLFNKALIAVGAEPVEWMAPGRALWSVSTMIVWGSIGYVSLLLLAGLQSIPQEYYDASTVDGASTWQQFRYITFPLLTPSTFFVIITSMIGALQTFGEVYVLKGPMDSTLTIMGYIYERAFTSFDMGYAAALSAFLIVIILIVTVLQLRLQRRWVTYDL